MEGNKTDTQSRRRHSNTVKTLVSRLILQEHKSDKRDVDASSLISSQRLSPTQEGHQVNNNCRQDGVVTKSIPQKYYLLSPQLYQSYRNETCIEQIQSEQFKILRFSGGRNQLHFVNLSEIELPGVVKLTLWHNGDYKLILCNEQIYFWHQDQRILDKYCQSI